MTSWRELSLLQKMNHTRFELNHLANCCGEEVEEDTYRITFRLHSRETLESNALPLRQRSATANDVLFCKLENLHCTYYRS